MGETEPRKSNSRLLIVEDDRLQLQTLTEIMEAEGFEVVACSTAAEALEHLRRDEIGVAVVDLHLPDLSGTQLLEKLQSLKGRVHAVIHTGYGSYQSAKDALNLGAFAYVEKAGDPNQLVHHVHRAFQACLQRYAEDLESAVARRTRELEEAFQELKQEITERKRMEEALRESEQRYRVLVETMNEGLAVQDKNEAIIYVNDRYCEIVGHSREELIGRPLVDFLDEQNRKILSEQMTERKKGLKEPYEIARIRKDGKKIATMVSPSILLDANGNVTGSFAVVTDVTERIEAEKALHESQKRLAEAEKLAAVGRVTARIAHEINNPMAGIKNGFRVVRENISQDNPCHKYLTRIDKEIGRVAQIIQQMLGLHRQQREVDAEICLGEVIEEVVAMLEPLSREHDVPVEVDMGSYAIVATLPENAIRQILYNLLSNGIEASPGGNSVKIAVSTVESNLQIRVSDRGHGIAEELRPHVFEPFFTTKSNQATGGLGLGLAISRSLAEAAHGFLDFESETGRGCQFRLTLPLTRSSDKQGCQR